MGRLAIVAGLVVAVLAAAALAVVQGGSGDTQVGSSDTQVGASDTTGAPAIIPVLASSELAAGPNRFLFSLTDQKNQLIAAPDVSVHLRFYDVDADPGAVAFEADSHFLWAVEDVRGLYASSVEFPHAGTWATGFVATFPDGTTSTSAQPVQYDVHETTSTPAIGAPAPPIDTPTAAGVGGDLRFISTDPDPLPRLYELSVADALKLHTPLVVIFATPAFCQSATCGPTLDKIKTVAADYPDVNFVHLEPYVMDFQNGQLQPVLKDGYLQPAPWTQAWGLITEPFVVVINADGIVTSKFEGAVSVTEIKAALDAL